MIGTGNKRLQELKIGVPGAPTIPEVHEFMNRILTLHPVDEYGERGENYLEVYPYYPDKDKTDGLGYLTVEGWLSKASIDRRHLEHVQKIEAAVLSYKREFAVGLRNVRVSEAVNDISAQVEQKSLEVAQREKGTALLAAQNKVLNHPTFRDAIMEQKDLDKENVGPGEEEPEVTSPKHPASQAKQETKMAEMQQKLDAQIQEKHAAFKDCVSTPRKPPIDDQVMTPQTEKSKQLRSAVKKLKEIERLEASSFSRDLLPDEAVKVSTKEFVEKKIAMLRS